MTAVDALQAVLAGEHAAVYAYGVVGARLRGTADAGAAEDGYLRHRSRRDRVSDLLVAEDATPVAASAAYDLGRPSTTPAAARALAARVELGLCGPYAELVGAGGPAERATAAAWCADAAVTAVGWGGDPVAFPGLPERA